jgi:hypothetical protein
MIRTIEAVIDSEGNVRLLEEVELPGPRRALVTILQDERRANETAMLSEQALAADWNRPEEDAAWSYLQPARYCSCRFRSRICRRPSCGQRWCWRTRVAGTGFYARLRASHMVTPAQFHSWRWTSPGLPSYRELCATRQAFHREPRTHGVTSRQPAGRVARPDRRRCGRDSPEVVMPPEVTRVTGDDREQHTSI